MPLRPLTRKQSWLLRPTHRASVVRAIGAGASCAPLGQFRKVQELSGGRGAGISKELVLPPPKG